MENWLLMTLGQEQKKDLFNSILNSIEKSNVPSTSINKTS